MAGQEAVPFAPQNAQEVAALIRRLVGDKDERGKRTSSAKKASFEVSNSPAKLVVDSWRLPDWDYKRGGLPTYARGLFTLSHNGRQEIATRGYDKFFNVGETEATKWENIEKHTKGPYELSLKENGCIIFISGLPDDSLLVCSKHSTGHRSDTEVSHAKAGERWVDKQLKALGRTRQELARELWKRNATAVCELCDDDFEEHILAYRGDAAGLYLHGINLNLPYFSTYPGSEVQRFAGEWGFKRTDFFVMDDILAVRKFLEECAETGTYNGRDIEGFVIRCKSKFCSRDYQDWFFKYKFEEPYLMYRQWRECTKALINGKTPRYKKHVQITEEYLLFARRRLATDRNLAKAYQSNHGIIGLRDDFLKEKNLKGSDIIRLEYAAGGGIPEDINRDVILVPIATIGCGKTTIALALQHIFGWGHVQNDNITGKNRPPRFTNEVLQQLEQVPVVVADRNNAQRHERKQITEDVHRIHPAAKLIALNYTLSKQNIDQVRQVTQNRVFARGDNHQTIQASSEQKKVVGIMEGFINRFEPFDPNSSPDDAFDGNIDLDPLVDSRQNLETVVARLHDIYPKIFSEMPSSDDLDDAIKFALSEYKPVIKHDASLRGPKSKENQNKQQKFASAATPKEKKRGLEYMAAVLPKMLIDETLEKVFAKQNPEDTTLWMQLKQLRRVQPGFHVTLIHRSSSKENPELWTKYKAIHEQAGSAENRLGDCEIMLERVVWNDKIMAIVVRVQSPEWEFMNKIPHITVGTISPDVKPKESNGLLEEWLANDNGRDIGIHEVALQGVVLNATVQGVLSRH